MSFHNKAPEHIPEALLPALGPLLETIGSLTRRIREYDRRLETISKETYPETGLLRQVEGVGPLTALTFVLTVEDPHRFERSRSVGAYLGLVPAMDQSGDRDPQKRISKEGDEMLRKLLVSCAHYVLGPFGSDSDLRRHGEKIASRGGKNAKKRAVVAVARKLAVLLHSLWISAEVYEPLRNTHRSGGQARLEGVDALLGPQHLGGDLGDQHGLGLGSRQLVALGLGGRYDPAGEFLRAVDAAGLQPACQAGLAEPADGRGPCYPAHGEEGALLREVQRRLKAREDAHQ